MFRFNVESRQFKEEFSPVKIIFILGALTFLYIISVNSAVAEETEEELVVIEAADDEVSKEVADEKISKVVADDEVSKEVAEEEVSKEVAEEEITEAIVIEPVVPEVTFEPITADISLIYDLALENDATFLGSRHKNLAEEETYKQVRAKLLPKIIAEANQTDNTQNILSSDNAVFAEGQTTYASEGYTLTITQPLFDFSLYTGFKQAQEGLKLSDLEFELARQELILRVAETYFSVLAANDRASYSDSEVRAAESQYEYSSVRKRRGLVPSTDLYNANTRLAFHRAESIEINNILDDQIQGVQEISGEGAIIKDIVPLKKDIPLVSPDPSDVKEWIATAMEQNIAIGISRVRFNMAKKEVMIQKSGHFPTLNLVGRFNKNETDGTLFGGGSEVETEEISLQLRLPIFEGGATVSRTREALEYKQVAWQNLAKESRAVQREVRAAYSGVKSSVSRVNALQKSVDSQNLVLEAKRKGFRSGLYTSLSVLDAARDLYQAKQEYAKARYDYILNSLRLRFAVGTLNSDDLHEINNWLN